MNRLKDCHSSFLREAAEQPVDWYPWGEEAFERAKREDKPVLVDVGAVWCHWCHVMDRETYSDPEIALFINTNFVAVKVDRDEMPSLDRKLQRAVSSITGESGWPLTVFMTPEGTVFFGGTYFPPVDMYGRIGMKRLLKEILRIWREERGKIKEAALALMDYSPSASQTPSFDVVETAISSVLSSFDFEYGGLGTGMKFPHPTVDNLLLSYSHWTKDDVDKRLALFTLKKMYQGGIFDQVGGGFHRYATDREWNVPHFEKLLIDNAELLEDYLNAYLISGDPQALDALELTLEFVLREMTTEVGFASSVDADSEGEEGGFYVWEKKELMEASGKEWDLVNKVFQLVGEANLPGGVLRLRDDSSDLAKHLGLDVGSFLTHLRRVRETLRTYRDSTRKKPFRDDNLYTYPNCRIAEGIIRAFPLTGMGLKEALRVVGELRRRVSRRLQGGGEGLLEDYASALLASLSAYEVTGDLKYRDLSLSLGEELISFLKPEGFTDSRDSREVPVMDTPNESPNSLALRGILKLGLIEDRFKVPEETLGKMLGDYYQGPPFYAGIISSIGATQRGLAHVVVIDEGDGLADKLHREALLTYHPLKLVERVRIEDRDLVTPLVRSMIKYGNGSRAYICVGNTCSLPQSEPDKIKLLLKSPSP